jgi:membrane-associated protease RseP (regulator of RpoE activity)
VVLAVLLLAAAVWLAWPAAPPSPAPPTPKVAKHRAPLRPSATAAQIRRVPGSAPVEEPVAEAAAADEPAPVETHASVYGRVHGAEKLPDGAVQVEGCGLFPFDGTPVDASGEFFADIQAGECRMRAWRMQGALRIPGPWVDLDAVAGVDASVDLSVPDFEPAGMGITFRAMPDGVYVLDARDGSPAAEAGLQHGDRILFIDGDPTSDMDQDDFLTHGIGPPGTTVHLQGTTADGEPFDVTMTRRPIQLD